MPRKNNADPEFSDWFREKVKLSGKSHAAVYKAARIGRSSFYRYLRGHRPEPGAATELARILGCSLGDLVARRLDAGWRRPDVTAFLNRSGLALDAMDSAIVLYHAPEYSNGSRGWFDGEVELRITEPPFKVDELKHFESLISDWARRNQDAKPGIKYCVTEVKCPTAEDSGKLILTVRPIEFHTTYPVNGALSRSYHAGSDAYVAQDGGELRKRFFSRLPDRDHPLIPNTLVTQMTAVTRDNKLVLARRKKSGMRDDLGSWGATCEERFNADYRKYLNVQDVFGATSQPDLTVFGALIRTLSEELMLTKEEIVESEIRVLAFGFEFENFNTSLFTLAKIPVSGAEAVARIRSHEEYDLVTFCPFTIPALRPVFEAKNAQPNFLHMAVEDEWEWHPTARMRIYLSLSSEYAKEGLMLPVQYPW